MTRGTRGRPLRGWLAALDEAFFVGGGLASAWLAYLTLREGISPGWPLLLVVVFWVLVAYLVLPRLHRILTGIYVPDYFIGRTRTADGLLGDPVNVAVMGSAAQVHEAMERAGWTRADDLSLRTGWGMVASTLTRRSYPEAPVSPLFLFQRRQDFAYQQEVAGSPSKRHHVRFWKCPPRWLLPGGFGVDWLAAGTYDRSVGLSLFTLQVTHKIDQDVDGERDHIVGTVLAANPEATVSVLEDFSTGYHSRNGGGDLIETDGDLPILDLTDLAVAAAVPAVAPVGTAVRRKPGQVVFGGVIGLFGAATYLGLALLLLVEPWLLPDIEDIATEGLGASLGLAYLGAGVAQLLLAAAVLAGRNWARLVLCAGSVFSVASTFLARSLSGEHGPLHASLAPLAINVLVLLALSSEAARSYATGTRRALTA